MNLVRGLGRTALASIVLVGCVGSEPSPTSGGDGADGRVNDPPSAQTPPPVGATVIDGVFVSASKGLDGADGSMRRPVKTIAAAIPIALQQHLPVIACAETYNEAVKLTDGVTMFGYFDCSKLDEWKRVSARAIVQSPTSPAVLAEGLNLPTRLEGFDFMAAAAAPAAPGTPAASSYGMIVRGTQNLTLAELMIRAGNGGDGIDGAEPAQGNAELGGTGTGGAAVVQRACSGGGVCQTANHTAGAGGGTSRCRVGPNGGPGGEGGAGPVVRNQQYARTISVEEATGRPSAGATSETAAGGAPVLASLGTNSGVAGAKGAAGPNGKHGSWSFDANGFLPVDGTAGGIGLPGQGGGGGAGTTSYWGKEATGTLVRWETGLFSVAPGVWFGAAGGGGGAGGCGGLPGTPGTSGGASVGLFVVDSQLVIEATVRIEALKGGRAGKGALGTVGTPGNGGGVRVAGEAQGAAGGNGGAGGAAGLSGHGAPGPSIALVFSGPRPQTRPGVELAPGVAGEGAPAVTRDEQSLPAVVGEAKAEHQF